MKVKFLKEYLSNLSDDMDISFEASNGDIHEFKVSDLSIANKIIAPEYTGHWAKLADEKHLLIDIPLNEADDL